MVKVLVAQRAGESFPGFWAEFEGEKVSSYEDTRGDKNIVYTLYRCTAYNYEAYRVHIADESNPNAPVYEREYSREAPSVSQGHRLLRYSERRPRAAHVLSNSRCVVRDKCIAPPGAAGHL
jgi:hypothetical protein